MTREELENRIKNLDEQLAQAVGNVNAIHGAKQEVQYWLEQLAKLEAVERIKALEAKPNDDK